MSNQRILRATTTSLVTYPRLSDGALVLGVPSNPEVRIGTPASAFPSEDDAWPTGTVDPLSAVVTVAAVEGDTSLILAATATVTRGRKYLVQNAEGDAIVVTAARSTTGSTIYLSEPLERDLSPGATVKGWAITKALTSAQTDQVGNGLAIFAAAVNGVAYSWSHPFRIVRRMVVVPLTGPELVAAYPLVHSLRPATSTLDEIIDAAWQYRLLPKLGAKSVLEDDIVDAEVLRPLLALACVVHLVALDRSAEPTWRDSLMADFDRLTETTMSHVGWHDAGQEQDPTPTPEPTRRRMGLKVTR